MAHMPIRRRISIEVEQQLSDSRYPHSLQIYKESPSGYVRLDEMQEWCVNRLRVLKLVEQIAMQNRKSSKHCITILNKELENNGICDFARLINTENCESQESTEQTLRQNDCTSHFILRSAFSFEHEKRRWFFNQETRLFKWRISSLDRESIKAFNRINRLQYTVISEEEKKEMKEELQISCRSSEPINNINFYKVHFTHVLSLIAKRQVHLKSGIAYVPETKISRLFLYEFKRTLNEGFAYSREIASNVYNDERITPIFSILPNCVNTQYSKFNKHRRVHINELDELSRTSYPLCMRLLHEALKTNHHLTNGGRVQYCLFLKGIGLTIDDALELWKREFTQKISEYTFERKYSYTVRHLYGQEGKRADYEPFSCSKIFNSIVGVRDNHGCPFKHMPHQVLRKTLSEYGLVRMDIESMIQLSMEGCHLEACKKYYEISHNCITENTFKHPNVYFNLSRNIFENTSSDTED